MSAEKGQTVKSAFRCVRCGIPATDAAESLVQPGVLLTVHLPMTDEEGRTVEWCRQHGGPVKPVEGCEVCCQVGPLLVAPGTSGRSWACSACGHVWRPEVDRGR